MSLGSLLLCSCFWDTGRGEKCFKIIFPVCQASIWKAKQSREKGIFMQLRVFSLIDLWKKPNRSPLKMRKFQFHINVLSLRLWSFCPARCPPASCRSPGRRMLLVHISVLSMHSSCQLHWGRLLNISHLKTTIWRFPDSSPLPNGWQKGRC